VREKRKKIWVHRFQTYLSVRIALFLASYQAAVWSVILLRRSMVATLEGALGQAATASWSLFLAGTVVAVGLLFIYDTVRYTHRVVGPLYRFRKTIQAITAGEEVPPLTLRKGDFLQEMKDDLNAMLQALERRGAVVVRATGAGKEPAQPQSVPSSTAVNPTAALTSGALPR
jgi:hypothetical protein